MIRQPPGRASRALPVLDVAPPSADGASGAARPRDAARSVDERLVEFRPEDLALPRYFVWTLGCQMNRSDSEEMAGRLQAAGCAEAATMELADLVVINTCAIREAAEQKVIGRQGHLAALKRANPGLRVVLTGCSVREAERAGLRRRYPSVDLFLRPDEEPELVERLGLAGAQAPIGLAPRTAAVTTLGQRAVGVADHLAESRASAITGDLVRRESRTHAWLPIIYGCDKTCTYCIVPFSRGPERSRPFDEIVAEARRLAEQGFQDVTLLGQNVNSYGHDLPAEERFRHIATERWGGRRLDLASRPDLAELLRAIDGIRTADGTRGIPRLRFVTSHPWDLSDRLIEAMAGCRSVCEHLHLPVQSGDDAVLRRMGRQYTIEHYLERLGRIRDAVPGIALSTDVIVGFPGETEVQFQQTLDLLAQVRYETVFAAAFSPRPGTPAERLVDDVPAAEKRRRLNELLALQEGISAERNGRWLGRTTEVLVDTVSRPRSHEHGAGEAPNGEGAAVGVSAAGDAGSETTRTGPLRPDHVLLAGRNRENRLVHLSGPVSLVGRLVDVQVNHAGPYALRGVLA
jgi:tRNA-2-methylthio-N6-dimethylallyladenosine synthase